MSNTEKNILTIFTPTYNRAYILPQLYNSLKNQSNQGFEWIVVDDGSGDETESLVSKWIGEEIINIRYIKQCNAGKMKAHNVGVEAAQTELFLCVDSDDWLLPDSVKIILNRWEELSETEKESTAGFVAYRGKNPVEVIGNCFPDGIRQSSLSGLYANGFRGDTTIIFKTELIKQHPFPIIAGEKFITEAYIYEQIDLSYTYHLIPSVMIVCEYRNDGLTLNLLKLAFNNPGGYTAYYIQKGNFSKNIKDKMLHYIRANCFRKETKGKTLPVSPDNKMLYNLMYIFGTFLHHNKKKEYMNGK